MNLALKIFILVLLSIKAIDIILHAPKSKLVFQNRDIQCTFTLKDTNIVLHITYVFCKAFDKT